MNYTALDIAKWFINATDRQSGDSITHLKVQKLLYYAQGWAMVHLDKPLFDEDLQAWAHGPVAVSVYHQFKDSGFRDLDQQKITRKISSDVQSLLVAINDQYGKYTAKYLEKLTHNETPWKASRGGLLPLEKSSDIIPKEEIKKYFDKELKSQSAA